MEADLQRFYGIDYRDRWRPDAHGRPLLTLRRLMVLIEHLPAESVLQTTLRQGRPAWRLEHVLLAHVWQAAGHSKEPHPWLTRETRRSRGGPDPRKLAAARARAAKRKRAIEAGRIT